MLHLKKRLPRTNWGLGNAVKDFCDAGKDVGTRVAEVVRLRAMPENDRILTNSATKVLNGLGLRICV